MINKLKKGLSVVGITTLGLVTAVGISSTASAHNASISDTCEAVTVNLTNYNDSGDNSVSVTINGTVIDSLSDFGTSFSKVYPFADQTVANTYHVVVDAHDGTTWDKDVSATTVACAPPVVVDYCNPAEKPGGISIAAWLKKGEANGADCFNTTPTLQCGSLDMSVTGPASIAWGYQWFEGADQTPAWPGNNFPATFPEDYNGGSVTITTWLAGGEKDYVKGFGLPNLWDGNGRNVTINTDCVQIPPVKVSIASICTAVEDVTISDTEYKTDVDLPVLNGDRVFRIDNPDGATGPADITKAGTVLKTVTLTGAQYQTLILPASLGNVDGIKIAVDGNTWTGTASENGKDCTTYIPPQPDPESGSVTTTSSLCTGDSELTTTTTVTQWTQPYVLEDGNWVLGKKVRGEATSTDEATKSERCAPPEPDVNYCNPAERPAGVSIAQWLSEGEFNGADCFTITPNLQCGSFDATVDGPYAGYTWRYLEGAGMTPDLPTGMALPAAFGEDYSGGSVQITVWLEGPEKDYLVGTGLPNYWDGNGRTVTIDTDCAVPEPVAVDMNLTYMTACSPDPTNTWRIRNSSDMEVPYTLEYAGQGVVASGIAPVGDSFVNLPRETATAILKWGGGDSGIIAGSKTKASGVDEFCPIEITEVSVTTAEVPICGPNNDPLNISEVEGVTFDDTGWVGNERTITAAAAEGYALTEGSVTSWTFTDVPVAGCPDEPPAFSYTPTGELAYTGASTGTNGLTALAIFLMASGTALVGLKVRAQR